MIFNDDYDASLWCIVKGDKKNRKQLVQFLRELPEELIWKIRETLAKADRYELEEVVSFSCKNKTYTDVYYSFDFDPDDPYITIVKGIDDGKMVINLFELMLNPINKEILKRYAVKEEWLGTISNSVDTKYITDNMQETTELEREYMIRHLLIGYFVSCEKYNDKRVSTHYKPIIIDRIPKDITRGNILKRKK